MRTTIATARFFLLIYSLWWTGRCVHYTWFSTWLLISWCSLFSLTNNWSLERLTNFPSHILWLSSTRIQVILAYLLYLKLPSSRKKSESSGETSQRGPQIYACNLYGEKELSVSLGLVYIRKLFHSTPIFCKKAESLILASNLNFSDLTDLTWHVLPVSSDGPGQIFGLSRSFHCCQFTLVFYFRFLLLCQSWSLSNCVKTSFHRSSSPLCLFPQQQVTIVPNLTSPIHYLLLVQSLSHVRLSITSWTAACQASLSFAVSQSLLKLMSVQSVMLSNHLIFCRPLLLPSIFPSIRVFSSESALRIRWPKYWSFSFSISPFNEYSGLISFRMDWFDLPLRCEKPWWQWR